MNAIKTGLATVILSAMLTYLPQKASLQNEPRSEMYKPVMTKVWNPEYNHYDVLQKIVVSGTQAIGLMSLLTGLGTVGYATLRRRNN